MELDSPSPHRDQTSMSLDTSSSDMPLPAWLGFATDVTADQVIGIPFTPGFDGLSSENSELLYQLGKSSGQGVARHRYVVMLLLFGALLAVLWWLLSAPVSQSLASLTTSEPAASALKRLQESAPAAASSIRGNTQLPPNSARSTPPPRSPQPRTGTGTDSRSAAIDRSRHVEALNRKETAEREPVFPNEISPIDSATFRRLVEGL